MASPGYVQSSWNQQLLPEQILSIFLTIFLQLSTNISRRCTVFQAAYYVYIVGSNTVRSNIFKNIDKWNILGEFRESRKKLTLSQSVSGTDSMHTELFVDQ